eukprot:gene4571-9085_t
MTTYIAIFFCLLVISYSSFGDNHQSTLTVQVLHFIKSPDWGIAINGDIPCSCCTTCKWFSSYNIDELKEKSKNDIRLSEDSHYLIKVAVYNIHSWKEMGNHTGYPYGPSKQLITNLTLVESEESFSRFPKLFQTSFKFYDGYSTSHPNADVPRYYEEAILNQSQFIPRIPYSKAVKAAVYVTSTCHRRGTALRDRLVNALGKYIRVDSIGSCLKSPKYNDTVAINESIGDRLLAKRVAISKYLFYLAFENTIEPGYVAEKVLYQSIWEQKTPFASKFCGELYPTKQHSVYFVIILILKALKKCLKETEIAQLYIFMRDLILSFSMLLLLYKDLDTIVS